MLKSTPFFPQCMSAWLNTIKFTVIITSYFFRITLNHSTS